jgi:hypothetical protein
MPTSEPGQVMALVPLAPSKSQSDSAMLAAVDRDPVLAEGSVREGSAPVSGALVPEMVRERA